MTQRYIWLTRGFFTLLDAEDYVRVIQFRWYAQQSKRGVYAACRPFWKDKIVLMHRFLMNAKSGEYVDHRDGETLDNRKSNLRIVTQSQNMHNTGVRTGSSGFKGVSWAKHANKWEAYITVNYKRHHLGLFDEAQTAAIAYDRAAVRLIGEYARTNLSLGLIES